MTETFSEDDLLPLSALQHLVFCERQCALIHLEGLWADNALTVQGSQMHEGVDEGPGESRGDLRIARGLALRSLRLGLTGRADAVELHLLQAPSAAEPGAALPGVPGRWRPVPVEYKRGKPKLHQADEVQLCAQALCLEEMLGTPVPQGFLFYGRTRRRQEVAFEPELRRTTEAAARRWRELFTHRITPKAVREPKCDQCSLLGLCLPEAASRSASAYLARSLRAALDEKEPA